MTDTRVVAKVFVTNSAGNVLLLQRSESDPRRPLEWDIPGGHTNAREFAEEAAARETYEETGLTTDSRSLRLVGTRTAMVSDHLHVSWLFFTASTSSEEVVLSSEHVAYEWVSPQEALRRITYDVQHEALKFIVVNNLFD